MSILRTVQQRSMERRGADPRMPWGNSTPPSNGMLGGPVAGTAVNEKTALQVTAVYGSVGVLCDGMSTLPLTLLSDLSPAKRKKLAPSKLITQPFCEISLIDWLTQFVMSLALRGNFYGQIVERDRNRYPTQIKPIHPDDARVTRLHDGTIEYRYYGQRVNIDDVFHVRYLSTAGSLVGLNPIEYLRNAIGLARAADLYGGSFFQNSAMPSGVIEVADELDEDETLSLGRAWMQMHQGIGQANLPAVLTGGATFKPISITPEDSQFLASRQFSAGEISGMIFRVPPHMIGIVDRTTSWGTGIEQQESGFIRNTLIAYISRFESAITDLHAPGQYVRFNLSGRLRSDKLIRYQTYALGIMSGLLCSDDCRAEEDLPPLPDGLGQTFLAPINSTTLANAIATTTQNNRPPAPNDAGQGAQVDAMPSRAAAELEQRAATDRLTAALVAALDSRGQAPEFRATINMPEQPAPHVEVHPHIEVRAADPAPVTVNPHIEVHPTPSAPASGPVTRRVVRDAEDRIVSVVEE